MIASSRVLALSIAVLALLAAPVAADDKRALATADEKRAPYATPEELAAARAREAANTVMEQERRAFRPVPAGTDKVVATPRPRAGKVDERPSGRVFQSGAQAGSFESEALGVGARLDADSARFFPLDAGLAREDLALGLRLASIRAGSTTLLERPVGAAGTTPWLEGPHAVLYRHAGPIDERYEARADGFEQTFTIYDETGLRGGADLILECALDGPLVPELDERTSDKAPLYFSEAGRRVLTYGSAIAIDAAGRRLSLPVTVEGTALRIAVDGAWVASAAFPLVIDPLIGTTVVIADFTTPDRAVDVAFSPQTNMYVVVWDNEFSVAPADHDIGLQVFDATGFALLRNATTGLPQPVGIDITAADSIRPSVAWSPNTNRFLVAWEDDRNLIGSYDIFGSVLTLTTTQITITPVFEIYGSASNHGLARVGALDSPTGGFIVAWTLDFLSLGDFDVAAIPVANAGGTPPTASLIDVDTRLVDSFGTAVNKLGRGATPWLVVWSDDHLVAGDFDIFGKSISATGALGAEFSVAIEAPNDEDLPVVAGDGTEFVVAYAFAFSGTDLDVKARRTSASAALGTQIVVAGSGLNEDEPAIARWEPGTTGTAEYGVAFKNLGTTPASIAMDRLATGTLAVLENNLVVSTGGTDAEPALDGRKGFTRPEYFVAWERTIGANVDLIAQRVEEAPPTPPVAQFTAAPTTGQAPLLVTFTDASTGNITSRAWDFDNNGTTDSTAVSPTFTYTTPGTFTVKLTVTGPGGSDDEIKTNLITVTAPPTPPVAQFTANPTTGVAPLTVAFTDTSTGTVATRAWDFQNDGTVDSTAQNPTFTYTTVGTFTVKLTVTGPLGTDDEVKTNLITVNLPPPPVAQFTAAPTSGIAPVTVTFTDASTGSITSRAWDFDNNGTVDSTATSPTFTYTTAGTFTVKLTATGPGGSDDEIKLNLITVAPPLTAQFTAIPTSGPAPLLVSFADLSVGGATAWAWDFDNDGNVDDARQHPSFLFQAVGTYTVKLRVTGPTGTDDEVKLAFIDVSLGANTPVADFDATPDTGPAPLVAAFNDLSSGPINSRTWSFGDGVTSSASNPVHTFQTPGSYTVFLTVSGPGGIDTKIRQNYVVVTAPTTGGSTGGTGGSTGGGVAAGPTLRRTGGGGGSGGCAIGVSQDAADGVGALLPLLALIAAAIVARRR